MRRNRQILAALAFVVLAPVVAVLLPPSTGPASAHDDPLERKIDAMNALPPELAPDRSDLQVVGLESWLAPNRLTSVTPVPDVHEHSFLFWSYTESYLALPRRSRFTFSDGVTENCDHRGSRYSSGATNPDCGRHWFHTTAIAPMVMRTRMRYRVIQFSPFPRVYNKWTSESIPYLLDVGEIQAVGREVPGSGPSGGQRDPGRGATDCTTAAGSPCIRPGDDVPATLPGDPCGDWQTVVASIDASAVSDAMVAAADDPCAGGSAGSGDTDPGGAGGGGPGTVTDLVDPGAQGGSQPPAVPCDEIEPWDEWIDCVGEAALDELANAASGVYDLLPEWAQAILRALGGCAEFGGDALKDIWESFKSAGLAITDFPTWLEQKLQEIRTLIQVIRDDPEGFIEEAGRGLVEADLYEQDKPKWVGKMSCKIAAAIFGGRAAAQLLSAARKVHTRTRGDAPDREQGPKARCNSFPTGTPVLMADGSHRPIESVRSGDLVLAADPRGGEWRPREVVSQWSAVDDGQLATATLDDGSTVTATDNHRFWVQSSGEWVELEDVRPGDLLLTPDGVTTVSAVDESAPAETLVWELDIAIDDTFAVSTGTLNLLVHNAKPKCWEKHEPPAGYKGRPWEELLPDNKLPRQKDFNSWWNRLSAEELEYLLGHSSELRRKISAMIRHPGRKHEWCMCKKMATWKEWGLSMEQMKRFTTATSKVNGKVDGVEWAHGSGLSNRFHDALENAINDSKDFDAFYDKLPKLARDWGVPPSAIPAKDFVLNGP